MFIPVIVPMPPVFQEYRMETVVYLGRRENEIKERQEKERRCVVRTGFSTSALFTMGWGLSCALWGIEQHPWLLPTKCQDLPPSRL